MQKEIIEVLTNWISVSERTDLVVQIRRQESDLKI